MGFFDGEFNLNQVPMIGMIANDPANDAKRGGMHAMANSYQSYRPEVAQARMKALNNQMSMWAPVNNALGSMYGPSAQFDMTQATQSPLTNRMMDIGAPKDAQMLMDNSATNPELSWENSQDKKDLDAAKAKVLADRKANKKPAGMRQNGQKTTFNPGSM